jgi:hypothetical protein
MSALRLSATRHALKSGVLPREGFCPCRRTPKLEKKVVDNKNVYNHRRAIIRIYSGAPAGIHVLLILDFQDQ